MHIFDFQYREQFVCASGCSAHTGCFSPALYFTVGRRFVQRISRRTFYTIFCDPLRVSHCQSDGLRHTIISLPHFLSGALLHVIFWGRRALLELHVRPKYAPFFIVSSRWRYLPDHHIRHCLDQPLADHADSYAPPPARGLFSIESDVLFPSVTLALCSSGERRRGPTHWSLPATSRSSLVTTSKLRNRVFPERVCRDVQGAASLQELLQFSLSSCAISKPTAWHSGLIVVSWASGVRQRVQILIKYRFFKGFVYSCGRWLRTRGRTEGAATLLPANASGNEHDPRALLHHSLPWGRHGVQCDNSVRLTVGPESGRGSGVTQQKKV